MVLRPVVYVRDAFLIGSEWQWTVSDAVSSTRCAVGV